MDDFYQYTASAVNANNNNNNNSNNNIQQDEQNDPLIKAFTSFGWGQRFNSLMDTVKKQGEAIVDVTKKDLQEIASVLRDDSSDVVDQLSLSTTSTNTITPNTNTSDDNNNTREINTATSSDSINDNDNDITTTDNNNNNGSFYSSFKDNLEKINTMNFTSIRDGLTNTLNQALPTQITSIKLPDNINLDELRQELDQGTKFAEQYIQKFGTEVVQVLNRTITVLEPDNDDEDDDDTLNQTTGPKIYATRKEALIAKLQKDQDYFLKDPKDSLTGDDIKILETFNSGFNVQEYTEEIAILLNESSELRQTMDNLVPIQIDYTTFWQRYFYHVWKIDEEDKRRQLIVKGADEHDEEADFKWDSDDEDNNTHDVSIPSEKQKSKMKETNNNNSVVDEISTHDTNKSDTDFSNISGPPSTEASLVSPPLKFQDGDDWVKTSTSDGKKQEQNGDDSDSDWE